MATVPPALEILLDALVDTARATESASLYEKERELILSEAAARNDGQFDLAAGRTAQPQIRTAVRVMESELENMRDGVYEVMIGLLED